jgi:hypothetical protein
VNVIHHAAVLEFETAALKSAEFTGGLNASRKAVSRIRRLMLVSGTDAKLKKRSPSHRDNMS